MTTWFVEAPSHVWFVETAISANFTVDTFSVATRITSAGDTRVTSTGAERVIDDFVGRVHPGLWTVNAPSHNWSVE